VTDTSNIWFGKGCWLLQSCKDMLVIACHCTMGAQNNLCFLKSALSSSRKFPYHPTEQIGIFWEWGFSKTKIIKEMWEALLEFPEIIENPFHGVGMDIFWNYTFSRREITHPTAFKLFITCWTKMVTLIVKWMSFWNTSDPKVFSQYVLDYLS